MVATQGDVNRAAVFGQAGHNGSRRRDGQDTAVMQAVITNAGADQQLPVIDIGAVVIPRERNVAAY